MQKLSNEFYHAAIKNEFPDATDIKLPNITGKVAHVFTFQTDNGPRVCRFNEKPIIERNYKLTHMLYDFGVSSIIPTKPHVYLGQYFESYEYDPHYTLRETIGKMNQNEIIDTYKSAMCIQGQLASFPVQKFNTLHGAHFMDVYNITMPHYVDNSIMRCLYRTLYKHFATSKNMYILHSDLTPANMLVNDSNNGITHLIDFDAISVCNENMAIFGMLRRYPLKNINEMIDYYQDITNHSLNRREIIRMLNLFKKTLDFRMRANSFTLLRDTKEH